MWNRKELKQKAKKIVKRNYWNLIIVCLILAVCTTEFGMSTASLDRNNESTSLETNEQKIEEYEEKKEEALNNLDKDTQDVIESSINSARSTINSGLKSQKFIYKIIDAIASISNEEFAKGIVLIGAAIIAILYFIFIADPLIVGGKRFFIKQRRSSKTKISEIISVFKNKELGNIAKIMFLRNLYTLLWYLTIIGGFIKTYEYKMIPYLLADNPHMTSKEAFKLSKQMMHGNKWKTFVLDLSFIWWDILSIFTYGILSLLFLNPYIVTTETELYVVLKKEAITEKYEYYEKLQKEEIAIEEKENIEEKEDKKNEDKTKNNKKAKK